jgi:hypothetical protein
VHDGSDTPDLIQRLLPRLEALGMPDIAERLRSVAASLNGPFPPVPSSLAHEDLVSLIDAAALLELRSPTTIRGLADAGCLEGFCRAGEVVVSRRSIDALLDSPRLASQRVLESQLWAVLDDL